MDDGSRDGSWAVLQRYAEKDPRVIALHQENQGVSAARNTALNHCRGDYTGFADSDDSLVPGSLETLYQIAVSSDADVVIGGFNEVIGPVRTARNLAKEDCVLEAEAFMRWMEPRSNSFFIGVLWNKLFRTELIRRQAVQFTSGLSYGEDFLFFMQYLPDVQRAALSTTCVYNYVRNPTGLTFRQAWNSVRHPLINIRVKQMLFRGYCDAFRRKGLYEQYRRRLWIYLFRFTLNN